MAVQPTTTKMVVLVVLSCLGRCGHTEVFVIFLFCVGFDVTTPNLPMQNLSTKKFNTKYVCLSGEFSSDSTYVA